MPAEKVPTRELAALRSPTRVEHLGDPVAALGGRKAEHRGREGEVLGGGEIGVEAGAVAEVRDPLANELRLGRHVDAVDSRRPVGRPRMVASTRRRVVLPAPFGPVRAMHAPRLDLDRDAGQRGAAPEEAGQVVGDDRGRCLERASRWGKVDRAGWQCSTPGAEVWVAGHYAESPEASNHRTAALARVD